MRRWAIPLALGAALLVPIASAADAEEAESEAAEAPAEAEEAGEPAAAEEEAEAPEEAAEEGGQEEEEEEPGFLDEYAESMRTRVLTGLNGFLTAPADPVAATLEPPKALEKAGYVRRPLAFASGLLLMCYRSFSGLVDLGFAPIPTLPVVSPVPRYKLIPGFVHEDE
jgi:hypothetical protein